MSNNSPQIILSDRQKALVADLVNTYGLAAAEDIKFFAGDPKPFLSYEATCQMANTLLTLESIDIQPIETSFVDSIALKCKIRFFDGSLRSSVGVANVNEKVDGQALSTQQLFQLASARAIRNTLRTAGIDLIKVHESRGSDSTTEAEYTGRSNRASLIAQVHALGTEVGFIDGTNKNAWKRLLLARYGVDTSAALGEEQLADLVAALRALRPAKAAA